jgi:transposase-like protein
MSRRPRRNHSPAFKAKVAIAANKGKRTIAQISEQFDVHPNQVTTWKAQLEGSAADVFDGGTKITIKPAGRCRREAGDRFASASLRGLGEKGRSSSFHLPLAVAGCCEHVARPAGRGLRPGPSSVQSNPYRKRTVRA